MMDNATNESHDCAGKHSNARIRELERRICRSCDIEAALKTVRSHVWKMTSTDDILEISYTFKYELERLGIPFQYSGINIVDDIDNPQNVLINNFHEGIPWTLLSSNKERDIILDIWRKGKTVYRRNLAENDSYSETETFLTAVGKQVLSVVDVPFSHGTLAVSSTEPNAFSDEDISILERIAEVLSEGFSRRDDIEKLEKYTEQLEKEIVERKAVEDAYNASEIRYRELFDNLTDAVFVHTLENGEASKIMEVNNAAVTLLGYSREELLSMPPWTVVKKDNHAIIPVLKQELAQKGHRFYESALVNHEGKEIPVEVTSYSFELNGRPVCLSSARDITERKETEQSLRESEARYRLLTENAPVGIVSIDVSGDIVDINKKLIDILGSRNIETTRSINVLTYPKLVDSGISDDFKRCLETGEVIGASRRYESLWGKNIYFRYTLAPIFDSKGVVVGLQGIFEDITEQKRLEEQIQIRHRMDSLGVLAGGIAHDFNNILAGIMGNLDLLNMESGNLTDNQRDYVREAYETSRHAAKLIRDFQTLTTRSVAEIQTVDLYTIAKDVFSLLDRTTDKLIEKRITFAPGSFYIKGQPGQLHQVILNLATNATQAITEKGVAGGDYVEISAEVTKSLPHGAEWLAEDRYIHIMFSDSGAGMTEDVKRHVFEPLFTTKERGSHKGQGLGLALVYTIVTVNHNGFVDVDSIPGKGTTFHIYLPLAESVTEKKTDVLSFPLSGTETIMIVEDELSIRSMLEKALKRFGYKVLTASDGEEGLRLFTENRDMVDLVILDLTMPKMSGGLFLEKAREQKPSVRVIISSGHSEKEQQKYDDTRGVISKPYKLDDMLRLIRVVLDE